MIVLYPPLFVYLFHSAPSTGSANATQPPTTLPAMFAEYLNCPQHRALLLTLSVIVQVCFLNPNFNLKGFDHPPPFIRNPDLVKFR